MPAVGTGSVDIRSIVSSILNVIKTRANVVCTAPCDGAVLKMHYRWTFLVLIGSFLTVWYSWYHRDVITCVSHFNAETQVRLDYINICLSYPYVEQQKENGEVTKRYLLFYRWVHWSFLVMAVFYYIPRKLSKNMENQKAKKLIEELATHSFRYDNSDQVMMDKVVVYMITNMKTHNGLYYKFVVLNLVALSIDILAMHYLDFLLQGRFLRYGFEAFPFDRDPEHFTDYMSQMFPPFALCTLDSDTKIVGQRTEKFGCHLTVMELYEKVFLGLWVWLIILTAGTACYIVFLFALFLPKFREVLIRTSKPMFANDNAKTLISKVNNNCRIGDIYLLYRFKGHMSHARFYELMVHLSDPKLSPKYKNDPSTLEQKALAHKQINHQPQPQQQQQQIQQQQQLQHQQQQQQQLQQLQQQEVRNRKVLTPAINPAYLQQLYHNPDTVNRHGQVSQADPSARTPLLNKNTNTSILIE